MGREPQRGTSGPRDVGGRQPLDCDLSGPAAGNLEGNDRVLRRAQFDRDEDDTDKCAVLNLVGKRWQESLPWGTDELTILGSTMHRHNDRNLHKVRLEAARTAFNAMRRLLTNKRL